MQGTLNAATLEETRVTRASATTQHSDPCPDQPILEIGEWSLEKHDLLRKYVSASSRARAKWAQRAFVDLYCGPGRVRVRTKNVQTDGGSLVAWREAVRTRSEFTQIVVADIDPTSVSACSKR